MSSPALNINGDIPAAAKLVSALREVASLALSHTGKELREKLVQQARAMFGADAAALWRLESREKVWRIAAASGLSEDFASVVAPAPPAAQVAAMIPTPVLVADPASWLAADGRSELYERENLRSFLVIPLKIRGETAGTMTCYFRSPRESLGAVELEAAYAFADIASGALSTERIDQLAEVARSVAARLDLDAVVQQITDAATSLTGAQFGAFFYNVISADGKSYMLYTISGVPREHFEKFPMPRNTAVFAPTFEGSGIVRSANITQDPRYGKNAPLRGMPEGHLPVVSYLAVPVTSRTGEVLGGLFFGHAAEGVFGETEERVAEALAGHAAVAIDNVRLYEKLERERAALRREERRYRSLVTTTPTRQAIIVTNRDGMIEDDSPSWREITGQSQPELLGQGWMDAVHPDHRKRVADKWSDSLEGGWVFQERYLLRQADGSYRWFVDKTVPVLGDRGEIEEWISTIADVHEQHLAEESLKFLAKANELFASSLEYRDTLRNVARLAVPIIADWCAVDMVADPASGKFWDRLAVAHTDPAKVRLAEQFYEKYPPDPSTDMIHQVMTTGEPAFLPVITDEMLVNGARDEDHLRMLRELGIASLIILPLRSRGEVVGTITFCASDRRFEQHDLDRAHQLAHRASIAIENARLYAAAQAANRAKDEFLATLSHELRTPMTAVLGWARMLKLGLGGEEVQVAIDAIEQSAAAQAQLIEDVLDVSRIMSGKLTVDARPTDLRTVAQAAITTVHPAAVAKGIDVVTSIPPSLPLVAADEGRLQQIIWNLLSNAIKFTPRGGSVSVRVEHDGSLVRLSVTDTGEGIDRSFLPYVFEPFRQADSSATRPHGGIGLGLAIVRSLVELHGGRISAASPGKGRGATFVVELPVLEGAGSAYGIKRTENMLVTGDNPPLPSLDRMTVLVVDDQAHTRDVVAAVLRRAGASVYTASSVREGLGCVQRVDPHVVVCDIAMPEEDGYAFLREVRGGTITRATLPILALTAFGRPEDRTRALSAGFNDYLKKPVDPAELASAVQRLVTRASA